MACRGQLQLSKYQVISDSNKSDGNQTIPPPLRSKAIRLGLGRKIMRGRKRKWDNKNGSSQPSNRASHGNPSPVHVRIGQLLELPDTIRPIEFGTRSKMDAKPWTCQTCGQINQPIRYIIADLPPLNCTNNKCNSPINAEYEFSFTMERLLVNGICPVGNVKDQGTTDECALNSTCSALEITKRMSKVLLGEAPPGEFGEGPTISTKGLLKTYEQMMSLHDINNGWQDEKFNSTTLDAVCDIAICEGIKDLDDEHAMHKAAGKRRVPLDFGEISKKLANGTPLIAVINPGKKFSELKNGQIYKAPKDTTGKKSVDHAIVLIGAGKRRRCFFYHF